jgi:hypothetical protein
MPDTEDAPNPPAAEETAELRGAEETAGPRGAEQAAGPGGAEETARPGGAEEAARPGAAEAAACPQDAEGTANAGSAEADQLRLAWDEGPDETAPEESWLSLDDDDLLLRIESVGAEEDEDDSLLDVVESHRHFFVRQEAAKRVRQRSRLFAFEDDRHVGQILVRHLTRREDITYLERLSMRCRHVEVRKAAQVQLARVWRRVESRETGRGAAVRAPEATASATPVTVGLAAIVRPAAPPAIETNAPVDGAGVDASLLGWAAHFVVEQAWARLGTTATRELLRRTHADVLQSRPGLAAFSVSSEARVSVAVAPGERMARAVVADLAAWMVAFRAAAREVAPDLRRDSVRAATVLMADALREVGFYTACDAAEGSWA